MKRMKKKKLGLLGFYFILFLSQGDFLHILSINANIILIYSLL